MNQKEKKRDWQAKIYWDNENAQFITLKLMKRTEGDIIEFLSSIEKGKKNTIIKQALRDYMKNHPEED